MTDVLMPICIIAIAIIIILLAMTISRGKKLKKQNPAQDDGGNKKIKPNLDKLPYRSKTLLTPAELRFYQALKEYVGYYHICPKVGVKDLVFIPERDENYMAYFGKISQKHVDFVITHPETMKTLCVIELDDYTHNAPSRKERDDFIDKVFIKVDIPIVHIRSKEQYSKDDFFHTAKAIELSTERGISVRKV